MPSFIVYQRIMRLPNIGKAGNIFEERITWSRCQDFIFNIAQQAKNVSISFASAGGDHDVVRIERASAGKKPGTARVVIRNRLARSSPTAAFRLITQTAPVAQRRENALLGIMKTAGGGV